MAYNGFNRSVTVSVGEESVMVPPREAVTLEVPAGPASIETVFTAGGDVETVTTDLTDHGRGLVLYNVGNRALLVKAYMVYGRGHVPDEEVVRDQISFHLGIDHPFTPPPESQQISGDRKTDTTLEAWDQGSSHPDVISYLVDHDAIPAARAFGRAVMREGPVDQTIAQFVGFEQVDEGGLDAWCQQVIAEVPTCVERHRFCQDQRTPADAVVAEYTELLAANPDSGLHHYLLGRLSEPAAATQLYTQAVALDPTLGAAYRALADQRTNQTDDWSGILDLFDKAWHADPSLQWVTLDERLRLRIAMGQSFGAVASYWLSEVEDPTRFTGSTYGRVLEVHENPDLLPSLMAEIQAEMVNSSPTELHVDQLDLCLSARDIDCLRGLPAALDVPPVFLALSDGATEDERSWVADSKFGSSRFGLFAAVHELREGRDASPHLAAIESNSPTLAALFRSPPPTVAQAAPIVREFALDWRPIVWFGLYRLTDNPDFLAQAKVLALPYDLPLTNEI